MYELEVANERGDALQDLAEFQLAAVSMSTGSTTAMLLYMPSTANPTPSMLQGQSAAPDGTIAGHRF